MGSCQLIANVFATILAAFQTMPVHVMPSRPSTTTSLMTSFSLTTLVALGVCVAASALSAHYVGESVDEKMAARAPVERRALLVYTQLGEGTFANTLMLRDMSKSGLPLTNILLMHAYEQAGSPSDQDLQLMKAMQSMIDPDLLLLLSYAQGRFVSKPQDSTLSDEQLLQLNTCFDRLKERYDGRLGAVRSRYAYLNDLRSCQSK